MTPSGQSQQEQAYIFDNGALVCCTCYYISKRV